MATTYFANNYTTPMPSNPGGCISICREFSYTLLAALIINDIIKLCKIRGSGQPIVLEDFFLDIPDWDTSTGLALSIGDNTTAGKFVAIQTAVGQAAGVLTMANAVVGSMPAVYTTNNDFALKVTTAPTTSATTGTLKGWIRFHYQGVPTTVA